MFVQFGLEIAGSEIDRQAAFLVATVFSTMPMRSASFTISSSPSIFTRGRTIAEQDRITGLKVERNQLTAFITRAWTNGDHFASPRHFLGNVGNDDPALGFEIAFRAPDDDAVMEWAQFHRDSFCGRRMGRLQSLHSTFGTELIGVPRNIIYTTKNAGKYKPTIISSTAVSSNKYTEIIRHSIHCYFLNLRIC